METKNQRSVLECLRRRLRFTNSSYVDPVGIVGGLALWWTDEIVIDVCSRNQNLFRCVLSHHGISWLATFIHAPPREQLRNLFWDSILTIASENQFSWLCLGDFNEIGAFWEKTGGAGPIARRVLGFQQLLQECALMDLEFKGHGFTWTNNQSGRHNVQERIDRAVATVDWRKLFPHAKLLHELLIGSDHCPLILNTCSKLVLKSWGRSEFGDNRTKLAELNSKLSHLQALDWSEFNVAAQKETQDDILRVLLREEMFLHQRSRWLSTDEAINSYLHDYFSHLFTSIPSRNFDHLLSTVQRVISEEMNASLTNPVSNDKIRSAAFQLGPLKAPGPDGFSGIFFHTYWEVVGNDSAFVPGRLIQDNILVAHEAFHHLKLKKAGTGYEMAIKLDFNKAYDRIQWDFLEALLLQMGFSSVWVQWIMAVVSTVSFSIFANWEKRAAFIPHRGLRQGDPISPYLFTLVADVLSRMISMSTFDNRF
ncbi:uncharacterized protein LOC114321174 [Camellia sinensis]|uniref:uncharacterized protein LOC114321174 n=1 Tax=Camellia sinensis TaxID=4442 RepID=UPI001035A01B|nr:uncharacterized protein LOC114321174 [Camellia sinensis]